MHCTQARDLLLLACEREVSAKERATLTAHLAECPECRRFATAMRYWSGTTAGTSEASGLIAGSVRPRGNASPDLTERVLASVRPLPPPWVYHETQREKRRPHLIGLMVGALAVALAFVAVSLALLVALASGNASGNASHLATEAIVGEDVYHWVRSLPNDLTHTAITLGALAFFAALLLRWSHAVAMRVGHDRHSHKY